MFAKLGLGTLKVKDRSSRESGRIGATKKLFDEEKCAQVVQLRHLNCVFLAVVARETLERTPVYIFVSNHKS